MLFLCMLMHVAKWYFYLYVLYFAIICVLSVFTVKLGFSQYLADIVSLFIRLTEKWHRNLRKRRGHTAAAATNVTIKIDPASDDDDYDVDDIRKLSRIRMRQSSLIENSSLTIVEQDPMLLYEQYDDSWKNANDLSDKIGNGDDRNEFPHYKIDYDETKESFANNPQNVYHLADIMTNVKASIAAIVQDQIMSRFEAEKLNNWNLLTRNNPTLRFYNWKIALIWFFGVLFRYGVLFPVRLLNFIFGITALFLSMTLLAYIPECEFKKFLYRRATLSCFHLLSRWLGVVLHFHNTEYRPKNGIAVSNHTTPFDVLLLSTDNCYSLTGQKHNGLIGMLENILDRASPHLWFERSSMAERESVARRLREHVRHPDNNPILLFPEGTCINNTAVMQFKKGAFEVGSVVHPIALKYDATFGNAFWNSSRQSAIQHVFEMMTSWSIVCNIWYLPPMTREDGETAVDFANRVKREIAKQINVIDLMWDGQVKRMKPKADMTELLQKSFYEELKTRLRFFIEGPSLRNKSERRPSFLRFEETDDNSLKIEFVGS